MTKHEQAGILKSIIDSRRSVRRFTDAPIDQEVLDELLEAALAAPSGSNIQAWRFVVVDDPRVIKLILSFSPGISDTPAAIIAVCSDTTEAKRLGSRLAAEAMSIIDASMAAENLMLMATAYGIGSCAVKSYNDAAVRKILGLPAHIELDLLVTLGYPAREHKRPPKKPASEVVHFNTWTTREDDDNE